MLLIYSHISSSRLQYICSFIFKEQLGLEYKITIDSEAFKNYEGAKINYSEKAISDHEFHIYNHSLVFENEIKQQDVSCFMTEKYKAFFKTPGADLPFDIFAASFYLLSRYEEYLPHTTDMYGRFAHENALAFKEGFLNLPVINIWLLDLASRLSVKFPGGELHTSVNFQRSTFSFIPTYDIDIAYSYKHKGWLRNMGGFLKSPSLERIQVLTGNARDPFDSYDWLHQLHKQYALKPVYFFLVAEKNGQFDKNILPYQDVMWRLVKKHSVLYETGIHPSWQSNTDPAILKKEIQWLAEMSGNKHISRSRQHYIKLSLPETYRILLDAGIKQEYSMGYGSINGFRASVASSFFWYDLEAELQTNLRIHPFCFMDANSFYEQKFTAVEAYRELLHFYHICKVVNGTLITIWHNNFLGTAREFEGWGKMYEQFIAQVQQ